MTTNGTTGTERYRVDDLIRFASAIFRAAGCDDDKPTVIAEGLVEADLLGHTTHGLQLAAAYLDELKHGTMTATGEPEILSDRGAVASWDGRRLPGVWLAARAVDHAVTRAEQYGTCSVAIRRSHHIACLAAFLERATRRGKLVVIASSDPAVASVAPFGGTRAVLTPNPIAIGIPTTGDPILIDISASITTNGLANRLYREGRRFPGPWAMDAIGTVSDDPAVLFTNPPGTLLPTGGADHGHKGFGLALMIESLTQGLSGFGRVDSPQGWGASVFVQVHDPEAFASLAAFQRQSTGLVDACRSSPPPPGGAPVRMPGERGLELKRRALVDGLRLYPGIRDALLPHAERLRVAFPDPIQS